nr:MAG TPA: hypothetical protein [Caudoviricetes sp.]
MSPLKKMTVNRKWSMPNARTFNVYKPVEKEER